MTDPSELYEIPGIEDEVPIIFPLPVETISTGKLQKVVGYILYTLKKHYRSYKATPGSAIILSVSLSVSLNTQMTGSTG